jgi:hypothetical protein
MIANKDRDNYKWWSRKWKGGQDYTCFSTSRYVNYLFGNRVAWKKKYWMQPID